MPEHESKKFSLKEKYHASSSGVKFALWLILAIALIGGGYYWYHISNLTYTDKAEIYAPLIIISPEQPDVLREILVKDGQVVFANQSLARLEGGYLHAKTDGLVVDTNNEIGKIFAPGAAVVTMIDPDELRLIAHVQENKGLSAIKIGQTVEFTADAYGSKKYSGVVEDIARTADQSSVVFSISDKREQKEFSVKIKYDVDLYPELYNGMSARVWIYHH